MHLATFAFVASLASLAFANTFDTRQINGLPTCAQSCVTDNFQGCNSLDVACICGKKTLISDLSCCVSKSCSADDQKLTLQFAQQLCSTYQITLPTAAGCSGAAASATGSVTPAAVASSTPSTTGTKTGTMAMASASGTKTGTMAGSATGAASYQQVGSAVGVCAAMVGLVAML